MHGRTTSASASLVLTAALLAGCTSTSTGVVTAAPTATVPPATASSAPTVGSPPAHSMTAAPSTTPTSTTAEGSGCPATGGSIPTGAQVRNAGDLDRDGRLDQEFIYQDTFGVKTGSGAILSFTAGLAGGGDRHGWISTMEAEPPMAVVDDGRAAITRAFVDCRFVTPTGTNGKPYEFTLQGLGAYGTGVTCSGSDRGGYTLAGVEAVEVEGGRYRIDTTPVDVSESGTTAKNAPTVRGTTTYAAGSRTVTDARRSFCKLVPLLDAGGA